MSVKASHELFLSIKDHLRITYNHLDDYLRDLITEGIVVIESIAGETDFSKGTNGQVLLKAYCRYAFSNMPELFEVNYKSALLRLQIENGVKRATAR